MTMPGVNGPTGGPIEKRGAVPHYKPPQGWRPDILKVDAGGVHREPLDPPDEGPTGVVFVLKQLFHIK